MYEANPRHAEYQIKTTELPAVFRVRVFDILYFRVGNKVKLKLKGVTVA